MKNLTLILVLQKKINKASKGVGFIKELFESLPRNSLLNSYKSFIRPHADYCDIACD